MSFQIGQHPKVLRVHRVGEGGKMDDQLHLAPYNGILPPSRRDPRDSGCS